jgi:hypothetical protein
MLKSVVIGKEAAGFSIFGLSVEHGEVERK